MNALRALSPFVYCCISAIYICIPDFSQSPHAIQYQTLFHLPGCVEVACRVERYRSTCRRHESCGLLLAICPTRLTPFSLQMPVMSVMLVAIMPDSESCRKPSPPTFPKSSTFLAHRFPHVVTVSCSAEASTLSLLVSLRILLRPI